MGIIPSRVHTVIGLVGGIVLAFAPTLFGFADNMTASMIALFVGLFIVLNELITTSPWSPLRLVPMKVHIVLDVITGAFLAVSPWIFMFMDGDRLNQWLPHVIVGVMVIGYALLTSTADDTAKTRANA